MCVSERVFTLACICWPCAFTNLGCDSFRVRSRLYPSARPSVGSWTGRTGHIDVYGMSGGSELGVPPRDSFPESVASEQSLGAVSTFTAASLKACSSCSWQAGMFPVSV